MNSKLCGRDLCESRENEAKQDTEKRDEEPKEHGDDETNRRGGDNLREVCRERV